MCLRKEVSICLYPPWFVAVLVCGNERMNQFGGKPGDKNDNWTEKYAQGVTEETKQLLMLIIYSYNRLRLRLRN